MNRSPRRARTPGWLLLWLVVLGLAGTAQSAHLDVVPGEPFPNLVFSSLLHPGDYAKLGLERIEGPISLEEIPGEYLAVEFFNKSCRPCQRQVREMEAYYQDLLAAGDGTPEIRVLAVAVGNKARYLPKYRRKRKMTYPIAADPEFEQWRRLGDPGRTPFTVFLKRQGGEWILNSFHFGIHDHDSLAGHGRIMVEGRTAHMDGADVPPRVDRHEGMPLSPDELEARATRLLRKVAGRELPVEVVDLGAEGRVYRARVPLSGRRLYVRAATRAPVCEVCHTVHFLYVFDDTGKVLGFEPVHVTKYGNALWDDQDIAYFTGRLTGRQLSALEFDPEVDTVTSATMTSALIYDEVRRTRTLLDELRRN